MSKDTKSPKNTQAFTEIGGESPSNDAQSIIQLSEPLIVKTVIEGTSDFLFHRWSNEGVEAKSKASKGSTAKITDDIESYVYRDEEENLAIPGEYFRQACIHAAKYRQDPRSKRKSAMDLFKAGLLSLTNLCSIGIKKWDYEDKRRVVIQRSAVTRTRPALKKGWTVECEFLINLPEYISKDDLLDVLANAGRLVGVGDFRPTFGRFRIKSYE